MTETQQLKWPAEELLRRYALDQECRQRVIRLSREMPGTPQAQSALDELRRVGRENTEWLTSRVDEMGWPRRSEVSEAVAEGVFVLAQHADASPEFQRRALTLMQGLMAEGEVNPSHVALLTDRVLIAEGKRQRYGTQCVFDADGGWMARPCEDPANLNRRRAEMGLGPIEEYLLEMGRAYG